MNGERLLHPDRLLHAALWVAIAVPALWQLALLATAIGGRVGYPYDLEWMEGGMLHHALRIQNGQGIYVPPSVDFIPYLYTPLYPGLLALFGRAFGLTYELGRWFSILSLVGIAVVAFAQICGPRHRHARIGAAMCGTVLALGLFAATYPFVEGWFDLVRGDTLFLALITAGIAACSRWAVVGTGQRGHASVAAAATIMVLAFFTKQTGFVYVAFGGLIVLVLNWRRAVTYTVVAGVLGLGLCGLLDWLSDGWFWTYIRKIHAAHDFNMDRFYKSFGNILWHFPAMTILVGVGLVAVGVVWWIGPRSQAGKRTMPPQAQPLLLWSSAYAVSTVVGAIGWGTEFAHFNAYMPAFLHGALAAGAALPALAACVRVLYPSPTKVADWIALAVPAVAGIALARTCWTSRWDPARFIPTDADVAAGDALIERIHAIDGEVWLPSHPWYAILAGKHPYVHRMGVKDVTAREPRPILGLDEAVKGHEFAAIVFDDRDLDTEYQPELQQVRQLLATSYRLAVKLPHESPQRNRCWRACTGANVVPESLWVPAIPARPPAGARALFDFEAPTWLGWERSGAAWGNGPVTDIPDVPVMGATGHRFAASGGEATGRVTSPVFSIDGPRITMKLGGASDTKLRVELWVDDPPQQVKTASVPLPGGAVLREVAWDVTDFIGKQGRLVLVDDLASRDGYLLVDDVWIWPADRALNKP